MLSHRCLRGIYDSTEVDANADERPKRTIFVDCAHKQVRPKRVHNYIICIQISFCPYLFISGNQPCSLCVLCRVSCVLVSWGFVDVPCSFLCLPLCLFTASNPSSFFLFFLICPHLFSLPVSLSPPSSVVLVYPAQPLAPVSPSSSPLALISLSIQCAQ